eukprot:gene3302-4105_t
MGTFMEGMAMVITTIPLLFPVVKALGYDPIWFGVVITMLVEIAMISPPDGTVLYVLQGMRRQPGPITDVFSGVMPFMLVYMLAILVLIATTFSLFGFIIGIWAQSFEQLNFIPMLVVTPLTFLGGSFYSIHMLPEPWRTITHFNPVVYLISGFRWSFYGTGD